MSHEIPNYITTNFLILVAALFVLLIFGLNHGLEKARHSNMRGVLILTAVGVLGWLLFLTILASQAFFKQFDTLPPRLALAPGVPLVVMLLISRLKSFTYMVKEIPESWPIYAQSFRIFIELILWRLFVENIIPEQMTFEGLNFDVLSGILAIPVAYFCFTKKTWPKKIAIWYNILGLVLVTTIVGISIFSAPFPFRIFFNEPANTFVATVPYILLPGFVVPMAYFLHIVSLKQLLTKQI